MFLDWDMLCQSAASFIMTGTGNRTSFALLMMMSCKHLILGFSPVGVAFFIHLPTSSINVLCRTLIQMHVCIFMSRMMIHVISAKAPYCMKTIWTFLKTLYLIRSFGYTAPSKTSCVCLRPYFTMRIFYFCYFLLSTKFERSILIRLAYH